MMLPIRTTAIPAQVKRQPAKRIWVGIMADVMPSSCMPIFTAGKALPQSPQQIRAPKNTPRSEDRNFLSFFFAICLSDMMVSDGSNLKCRWQVHLANGICIGAQGSIVEGLGIKSKVQFARIAFVLYKNCFRTLQWERP